MFAGETLQFIPPGWYTQLYASVLFVSSAWLLFRGNRKIVILMFVVLLGWVSIRLSMETESIIPMMSGSILGGIFATRVRTDAGDIIAALFGIKIFLYSAGYITTVPYWIIFELSTVLGWTQIASLWIAHTGGKRLRDGRCRKVITAGFNMGVSLGSYLVIRNYYRAVVGVLVGKTHSG